MCVRCEPHLEWCVNADTGGSACGRIWCEVLIAFFAWFQQFLLLCKLFKFLMIWREMTFLEKFYIKVCDFATIVALSWCNNMLPYLFTGLFWSFFNALKFFGIMCEFIAVSLLNMLFVLIRYISIFLQYFNIYYK